MKFLEAPHQIGPIFSLLPLPVDQVVACLESISWKHDENQLQQGVHWVITRKDSLQLHCILEMVTLASCIALIEYWLAVQQTQGILSPSHQKVVSYTWTKIPLTGGHSNCGGIHSLHWNFFIQISSSTWNKHAQEKMNCTEPYVTHSFWISMF